MDRYDEETLAALLRELPPAPQAWVQAAKELPLLRDRFDEIIARAEADVAVRDALIADLETALAAAGYEPEAPLVRAVRARIRES